MTSRLAVLGVLMLAVAVATAAPPSAPEPQESAGDLDVVSDQSFGPLLVTSDFELSVPADGTLHCTTITISQDATLRLAPESGTRAVRLLASGPIVVEGLIDVSGAAALQGSAARVGGSLLLSSEVSVAIHGSIDARGGAGGPCAPGAGGVVWVVAPELAGSGRIDVRAGATAPACPSVPRGSVHVLTGTSEPPSFAFVPSSAARVRHRLSAEQRPEERP